MIRFFRYVRKQLLAENKFSNYFFYALGEIILVVIGILIALQINAVKQQEEDRSFELTMLNNIRNDIASDMEFNEFLHDRASNMDLAAQHLLESFGTANDSMVLELYPIMTAGISFEYRKGAYEALKSTGLDKISNDTIRDRLTTGYDFGLPRMSRWLGELEAYKEELVENLEQELFAPEIIMDAEGNREIATGIKVKDLLNDVRLLRLIEIYQFRAKGEMMRLETALRVQRVMLSQLNRELKDSYPLRPREEEVIETIGIIGTATGGGWETDLDMQDEDQDGIYSIETTLKDGELKFRANDQWTTNWGGYIFPSGYGMRNGENISVKAGHYKISLDIENGFYQFEKIDK